MSFSYSGDPSTSRLDACRFIISDTNSAQPIMQNEEITYLITTYGANEAVLRYNLFLQASTIFSREIKRSLGPQSEDPTSRLTYYKEQLAYYKNKISAGGVPDVKYAYPKVFRKGMQNNPPLARGYGYYVRQP